MRYYVVCTSAVSGIAPHVIAEVVRDLVDDDGNVMLAFALAGERRVIATRGELLEHPLGRAALDAWDAHDDSAFDDECAIRNLRTENPARRLRLVKTV